MDNDVLRFFVAYQKGVDNKYNYLGDGQGNIRLFKTQAAIDKFLDDNLPADIRAGVFTHPVNGNFVVPEPEEPKPITIRTLAPQTTPTAMELLENYKKRKRSK